MKLNIILIFLLTAIICHSMHNAAHADYKIQKIKQNSIIIEIGVDDFVQVGDRLAIISDEGKCAAVVRRTKFNRALLSTRGCNFSIEETDKVISMGFMKDDNTNQSRNHNSVTPISTSQEKTFVQPAQHTKNIRKDNYVAGGVLGTILGAGIGHFVQGRTIGGVGFLLSELVLIALMAGDDDCVLEYGCTTSSGIYAALLGVRIGEIVSVWVLPKNMEVTDSAKYGMFIQPVLNGDYKGLRLSMSF